MVTSLSNALQLDDHLNHIPFVRDPGDYDFNIATCVYPEELPNNAGRRHNNGPRVLVTFMVAARMQMRDYCQAVLYHDININLDSVLRQGRRFTRLDMQEEPFYLLGSIRSQSLALTNRNSSWIRYEEIDYDQEDEPTVERYGQVNYVVEVDIRGLNYTLACVHRHPVQELENRILRVKSHATLARDARNRRCGNRNYYGKDSKKWVWVSIDDIKSVVGRLITDRGDYIVNPRDSIVNPDLAFMGDPPLENEQDI